jgi:hypothetical protein
MQDKTPRNAKGNYHGRWVIYANQNSKKVIYRAYFIDGVEYGVEISITPITQTKTKLYYAK